MTHFSALVRTDAAWGKDPRTLHRVPALSWGDLSQDPSSRNTRESSVGQWGLIGHTHPDLRGQDTCQRPSLSGPSLQRRPGRHTVGCPGDQGSPRGDLVQREEAGDPEMPVCEDLALSHSSELAQSPYLRFSLGKSYSQWKNRTGKPSGRFCTMEGTSFLLLVF